MKIRPISRSDERRLLVAILYYFDGHIPNGFFARFRREIFGFAVLLLLGAVALCTFTEPSALKVFLSGGSLLAGLALGIAIMRYTSVANWPALVRCIDRDLVEARLRELDGSAGGKTMT